jgi:hypothetical protein
MDKSKSLSRLLNTVIKKKYSDISNIKVTYKLRSFISLRDGEGDYHNYDIEVICNNNDYEWDASDVMDDIHELSKMILVDTNENIFSIFFRQKKQQIDEIFDTGEMPNLLSKDKVEGKTIYHYTLPSKKSDENYHIKVTLNKFFNELNLKNVMELDFSFGETGEMKYTKLHEIFYLFTSINKVIEKHKKDFKYLIIFSSADRLSLYQKALSRIDYLNLIKKEDKFLLYENNDFSSWF